MINLPKDCTLDAAQGVFFQRQLEDIEQQLYKVKYPDLEAELFLPNRKQLAMGVQKHTSRMIDGRAKAVPFAGHEEGAPVADIDGDEVSFLMQSWILAYQFNVEEIEAAQQAGMSLEFERAETVRRGLAESLNNMALLGDAAAGVKAGIKGLFNQANTLTYSVPTTGSGSTKTWSTKAAADILIDLFGMVDAIPLGTKDVEGGPSKPMNMLMPKENLRLISTVRLGSVNDTTVLEFFKKQRPNVNIMGANYLSTAGAASAPRTMVYDPSQVQWLVAMPFMQLPVEQKGYRFVTNCRARGGGVKCLYPKSIIYGDGM